MVIVAELQELFWLATAASVLPLLFLRLIRHVVSNL